MASGVYSVKGGVPIVPSKCTRPTGVAKSHDFEWLQYESDFLSSAAVLIPAPNIILFYLNDHSFNVTQQSYLRTFMLVLCSPNLYMALLVCDAVIF